ncbi:hypothetical protein Scep_015875 [Stephania cephalantha]|uniref:Uncharacterized protein n=1 Tax=Stephania cephalantha TaxID=152367 RepID=A0AAP0P1W4_9MAGN
MTEKAREQLLDVLCKYHNQVRVNERFRRDIENRNEESREGSDAWIPAWRCSVRSQ